MGAPDDRAAAADLVVSSKGKLSLAVSFSSDGTLVASGCSERLLTVSDSARPHLGPLVQFLAYGDVTAVGFGPGVLPWPETLEETEDGVNKLHFKRWHNEKLPRCGDGFGGMGT